jgi:hypothetical protein
MDANLYAAVVPFAYATRVRLGDQETDKRHYLRNSETTGAHGDPCIWEWNAPLVA